MQSDEELLAAFGRGDTSAFGTLAQRHEPRLLNLAVAMLGSRDLAMDAVQETWVRVIRFAGTFNGRSSVRTWLYRIALNQCYTIRRARPEPTAESIVEQPAPDPDPAEAAAEADSQTRLRVAVEALPESMREVILLRYVNGLSHTEIAEVLDVPVGTVKSRIHDALEQLRSRVTR